MSQLLKPLPIELEAWLASAVADARRRGLPELEPLLRSLAASTSTLRSADWLDSVARRLPESARQ
jgi:hypothetical protein